MSASLAVDDAVRRSGPVWQAVRFKTALRRVEVRNEALAHPMKSLTSAGRIVARTGSGDRQKPDESSLPRYLVVRPGQLVVNPMWLIGGAIGVSWVTGAVSPDYRVFETRGLHDPRYLHHLLRSSPYMDQYSLYVRANTTFDRRVQQIDLDNMPVLVPPLDIQGRIADFLDDQVSRVDEAVRLRREQIEALEDQTVSALSADYDHLVASHGAVRLRYLGVQARQGWSPQCDDRLPEDGAWGVLKAGAVNGGRFRADEVKALPEGMEPRREFEVRAGDVLVNRASGSLDLIGSAAIVVDPRPRTLLCDKIYRLSAATDVLDACFFVHLWQSKQVRERLRLGVSGAEGMANSLPSGVIRDVPFPRMNLIAQRDWAVQAQRRRETVDAVVSEMTAQIDLLLERKRALITAAVTGEFDVTTASGRGV